MREKAVKDDISAKTVPIWFHHTVFTEYYKYNLHNPTPTLIQVRLMNWSPLPTRPPNTSTCLPSASPRRWRSSGTGKLQGLAMSRNQIFTKIFRRKFRETNILTNFKQFEFLCDFFSSWHCFCQGVREVQHQADQQNLPRRLQEYIDLFNLELRDTSRPFPWSTSPPECLPYIIRIIFNAFFHFYIFFLLFFSLLFCLLQER